MDNTPVCGPGILKHVKIQAWLPDFSALPGRGAAPKQLQFEKFTG
jgi:hypothetical protein